jgi:hypothetical protein
MFDYFKEMKYRKFEKSDEGMQGKPKKDKAFIAILVIFGVFIAFSLISGIGKSSGSAVQNIDYSFKFSISDGIILGVITLAYLIIRVKKGRK